MIDFNLREACEILGSQDWAPEIERVAGAFNDAVLRDSKSPKISDTRAEFDNIVEAGELFAKRVKSAHELTSRYAGPTRGWVDEKKNDRVGSELAAEAIELAARVEALTSRMKQRKSEASQGYSDGGAVRMETMINGSPAGQLAFECAKMFARARRDLITPTPGGAFGRLVHAVYRYSASEQPSARTIDRAIEHVAQNWP